MGQTDVKRKTLLVVDDQATIRTILVQVLKLEGYRVLSAVDGVNALETAAQASGKIDILITDLQMPVMGGEELIRNMTAVRPETRVICLSAGLSEVSLSQDVLFLPKPFVLKELMATVRGVLDGTLRKTA
jgi:two-component system, cell cycle sensor histidine kinase and response regulator CckA